MAPCSHRASSSARSSRLTYLLQLEIGGQSEVVVGNGDGIVAARGSIRVVIELDIKKYKAAGRTAVLGDPQ